MKKIFLAILSCATILSSCAKIEILGRKIYEPQEITFGLVDKASTKAFVDDTKLAANTHFGVYGYVKETAGVTDGGYIMRNADYYVDEVVTDPTTSAQKSHAISDTKYYWPKADNNNDLNVKFVAYYPYDYPHYDDLPNSPDVNTLVFDVTANAIDGTTDDILWAVANNVKPTLASVQNQLDENNDVDITFHHALAWIQFQGRVSSEVKSVKFTSIQFSNSLNTTGKLSIGLTDNTVTPAWSDKSGSLNQFVSPTTLTPDDEYSVLSNTLVIPQTIPTNVTITFDITIQNTDATGFDETIEYKGRTVTRTIKSGADDNNKSYDATLFEASHKYIYRVFVTADDVEFTASVDGWTTNWWQIWDHDTTEAQTNVF